MAQLLLDRSLTPAAYLEKYMRSVPVNAIAWERSIFSHTKHFSAEELIDAAVDIAHSLFFLLHGGEGRDSVALHIHQAGNYFVIAPMCARNEEEALMLVQKQLDEMGTTLFRSAA